MALYENEIQFLRCLAKCVPPFLESAYLLQQPGGLVRGRFNAFIRRADGLGGLLRLLTGFMDTDRGDCLREIQPQDCKYGVGSVHFFDDATGDRFAHPHVCEIKVAFKAILHPLGFRLQLSPIQCFARG